MADLAAGEHPLRIQTQYVKDLSFENPNAPGVYMAMSKSPPEVNVSIDVNVAPLEQRAHEVVLSLRVVANVAGKPAFLVDLQYAALITVHDSVAEADIEPLLHREGARFIFPFARGTLADVTRDGGFPPLVVNPIDFDWLYRRKLSEGADGPEQSGQAAQSDQTPAPDTPAPAGG